MQTQQPLVRVDVILDILASGAGNSYDGEAVDELAHALQAAAQAMASGADDAQIVAAALHDIGRAPVLRRLYPDIPHEQVGARVCAPIFGARVSWLIGAHVPAKRYLVATELNYAGQLSPASLKSLMVQGGPMNVEEVLAFTDNPWFEAAVDLRRWDDAAKVAGAPAPTLEELTPILERTRVN